MFHSGSMMESHRATCSIMAPESDLHSRGDELITVTEHYQVGRQGDVPLTRFLPMRPVRCRMS
jgi:hypothetical protein